MSSPGSDCLVVLQVGAADRQPQGVPCRPLRRPSPPQVIDWRPSVAARVGAAPRGGPRLRFLFTYQGFSLDSTTGRCMVETVMAPDWPHADVSLVGLPLGRRGACTNFCVIGVGSVICWSPRACGPRRGWRSGLTCVLRGVLANKLRCHGCLTAPSRRIMGITLCQREPTSEAERAFLGRVIRTAGANPRHLVSEQGPQLSCDEFEPWCRRDVPVLRRDAFPAVYVVRWWAGARRVRPAGRVADVRRAVHWSLGGAERPLHDQT